nr:MAG TPA: hypothetical protein [Caudoviricetes sp.]
MGPLPFLAAIIRIRFRMLTTVALPPMGSPFGRRDLHPQFRSYLSHSLAAYYSRLVSSSSVVVGQSSSQSSGGS